jgi:hypothetical protein
MGKKKTLEVTETSYFFYYVDFIFWRGWGVFRVVKCFLKFILYFRGAFKKQKLKIKFLR